MHHSQTGCIQERNEALPRLKYTHSDRSRTTAIQSTSRKLCIDTKLMGHRCRTKSGHVIAVRSRPSTIKQALARARNLHEGRSKAKQQCGHSVAEGSFLGTFSMISDLARSPIPYRYRYVYSSSSFFEFHSTTVQMSQTFPLTVFFTREHNIMKYSYSVYSYG